MNGPGFCGSATSLETSTSDSDQPRTVALDESQWDSPGLRWLGFRDPSLLTTAGYPTTVAKEMSEFVDDLSQMDVGYQRQRLMKHLPAPLLLGPPADRLGVCFHEQRWLLHRVLRLDPKFWLWRPSALRWALIDVHAIAAQFAALTDGPARPAILAAVQLAISEAKLDSFSKTPSTLS
ncbi:MAG: hypothetical protein M1826_004690 [Phylliscum demangeonii]|nr:MAG: hypothetical protein M1826_004690 [Phylliscum demangeonii]